MTSQAQSQIKRLIENCANYRRAVDRLLELTSNEPAAWRALLFEILCCASQLYLDYLHVRKLDIDREVSETKDPGGEFPGSNIAREKAIREAVRQRLSLSPIQAHFDPRSRMNVLRGLASIDDYFNNLTLHVPEVYEESIRLQAIAERFSQCQSGSALARMIVSAEHLARNHVSFLQSALDQLSDEDSWDE